MLIVRRTALATVLALSLAGTARAADAPAPEGTPWYQQPLVLVGGAVKAVGNVAGSMWAGVSSLFSGSDPYEYMPSQIAEDDRRFIATLDALGLQLSEIKVGGGTISHSSYRFVAARDPSDVDVQRAERKLADYRQNAGGLRNGAKQRIARSILDLAGDKGFVVTAVVVDLWPWPAATYEMSARNRPPEAGERRVIDATQQ
jgi:hypothetical protein